MLHQFQNNPNQGNVQQNNQNQNVNQGNVQQNNANLNVNQDDNEEMEDRKEDNN